MENPLLELGSELPFDRIQAEHVEPGLRALLAEAETRLDAIEKNPSSGYEATFGDLLDEMRTAPAETWFAAWVTWREQTSAG